MVMVNNLWRSAMVLALVLAFSAPSYAQSNLVSGHCNIPASGPQCCVLIHLSPGRCFSLSDVTAAAGSLTTGVVAAGAGTRVNIDNGAINGTTCPSGLAEKEAYWLFPAQTVTQAFQSEIVFSNLAGDVVATSSTTPANLGDITVTVSGDEFSCAPTD